jgi:hypothetical protein
MSYSHGIFLLPYFASQEVIDLFMHHPPFLFSLGTKGYKHKGGVELQYHYYHDAYFVRDEMLKNKGISSLLQQEAKSFVMGEPVLASLMVVN